MTSITTVRTALLGVVAAMSVSMLASGLAQPAGDRVHDHVYDLYQGPANLGEFGMTFTPLEQGATVAADTSLAGSSDSFVAIPGLLDLTAALSVGPDGAATTYHLSGSVQGVAIDLRVEFTEDGAEMTLQQAGQTQAIALPATEPLYVIDNNFIDGLQVVARKAMLTPGEQIEVAIVVPQVAMLGTATAAAGTGTEGFEHHGETIDVTRVEVTMAVAGQVVGSTLYLDENRDIVVLEQPLAAIRFVRRAAAGVESNQGVDDAGGRVEGTGAAEFLAAARQCVDGTEVSVASTGATLAGVLTLPVAAESEAGSSDMTYPTLLVLPGSGAVDLAGNSLPVIRNSGLEQLAFALGCRGYGVLRVAKLGIPPSTGDGNAVTLDTYARNTADWLALLAAQPGVDPDRLGILGHSEGGLVALYTIASGLADPAALVLVATPGRPFDVLLTEQLLARATEGGATAAELQALEEQTAAALEAIRSSTGTRLELSGALVDNSVAQAFSHAAGLLRSQMQQDPSALIASLETPILIVQGEKDLQVLPLDGQLLAAAAPTATLVAPPNLTHSLVDVTGPALEGLVPAPDAVISDALLDAIGDFLEDALRGAHGEHAQR